MMQIHDYRRAAFFGSQEEQKTLKSTYKEECDLLMSVKQQKTQEEHRRDKLHTQLCEGIFQRQVREQRMREIQRREQIKKVAEDNLMIAENKKKQQIESNVREKMLQQQNIIDNKIKTPTMVR